MYHLLALLTICIWGTTFVSTKVLLQGGLTPSGIFLMRFALAYVGMAAVCLLPRHHKTQCVGATRSDWWCRSWRDEAMMLVAGLTGGSMYFLTENTALEYARAGNVSLIVCLAPIATVLGAALLARLKHQCATTFITRRLWCGMLIALVGVSFIVSGDAGESAADEASSPVLGGALALAAAVLWAVYQNVVKPLSDRYGALLLTRKVFGYGLLTIVLYEAVLGLFAEGHGASFIADEMQLVFTDARLWGNLLFLGLIASLVCYFVWNKVVEHLGAVVSANYIYLNPLTTCLFSAIILGERLTPLIVVGAAAILLGVYLAVGRK